MLAEDVNRVLTGFQEKAFGHQKMPRESMLPPRNDGAARRVSAGIECCFHAQRRKVWRIGTRVPGSTLFKATSKWHNSPSKVCIWSSTFRKTSGLWISVGFPHLGNGLVGQIEATATIQFFGASPRAIRGRYSICPTSVERKVLGCGSAFIRALPVLWA